MSLPKKPSLCFFLPEMKWGGAEMHVILLASRLKERGFRVQIACLFEEGILANEVRRAGIPFECLHVKKGWSLGTIFRIFQWLRTKEIDVLHTYFFGFHFFAGFPARLLGIPAILSSRREIPDWQEKRHRWIENLGNLFVDRVVSCSKAVQERTLAKERVAREKVVTIHNGVDLTRFGGVLDGSAVRREFDIPDSAPLIGTVANFSEEKGYPYLVEAARITLARNSEARFLFVGFGPLADEIRARVKEVPGHERVVFAGARSDIPELLAAMDLFVLASVREGFPNVLLEAMAAGKPVVATRVGGIPELVDSSNDGILVRPRESRLLAQAIFGLLEDPERGRRLGERAKRKIEQNFSLERMVDDYETLYLSFWTGKGGRASPEQATVSVGA